MKRTSTAIVALLACLPVAWLAFGLPLPGAKPSKPRALPLDDLDAELVWLHTTTNAATWERFVKGVRRVALAVPDLTIDDSAAFPDDTMATPEVVVRKAGRSGALRIRWYKLANDSTAADWVARLATRDRPPLAVIGGGSTDRAAELARALAARESWPGARPLLFITTASADKVLKDPSSDDPSEMALTRLYDGRTFRFCFSNRQMAAATVDFVWSQDDLMPTAAGAKPKAIVLHWDDDPFSVDLRDQFRTILFSRADLVKWSESLPFSIGGTTTANRYERRAAEFVVNALRDDPTQRALLVLPTVTAPARRVLRAICELDSAARHRLVVLNGDGIPLNAVYRDGSYLWPVDQLPVPMVLFAHANPFGWDGAAVDRRQSLVPQTSTEDVLHYAAMATMAIDAAFDDAKPVSDAELYRTRLRERNPTAFDDDGNRLGGTGEFVAVVHPRTTERPPRLAVWRHADRWAPVTTLDLPVRPEPAE
jgi:hypothetical protein